jgi:MFS family permease
MIGARAIEGFATGVCLGPLGAGLIEDHRGRPGAGALVNNVLTSLGTALGAVACAWLLTTTGQRTGIPYAIAVGLTVVFLVVVWTTRDSNPRRPFHRELLVPRVSASKEARRRMVQSMPVAVAAASASGFTLTLGPSLVRLLTGSASPIHAAEAVTVFMVASGIAMVLIRSVRAERIIVLSAVSLTAGAAAVFLAAQTGGIGWLLVGVLLEGIGFGGAFDGTVRYVVAGADPTQRAGTLSVIFIVIYTSISVPTVVAGVIAGEVGVLQTTRVCAVFVGVMSLCVLVMHRRRPRLGRPVTDRSAP